MKGTAVATTLILFFACIFGPTAHATSTLAPGDSIGLQDTLTDDGRILNHGFGNGFRHESTLSFNKHGDLVLHWFDIEVWSAGTANSGAQQATMREDGNLVVTDSSGKVVWESNTSGFPGATLKLSTAERLSIVYQGRSIWTSGRGLMRANIDGAGAPHKSIGNRLAPGDEMNRGEMLVFSGIGAPQYLKLSQNGRLGLYAPGDTMLQWMPSTPPASKLLMNRNGNLNLLDDNGKVIWSAGNNDPGSSALLNALNLSVVNHRNIPVWSNESGLITNNITGFGAWHKSRGSRMRSGDVLTSGQMLVNQSGGASLSLRLTEDGRVGLIGPAGGVNWQPKKRHGKVKRIQLDHNGNLNFQSADGRILWRAAGGKGAMLKIDTFGLYLTRSDGSLAWSSRTGTQAAGNRLVSGQEIWGPWRITHGKQNPPQSWDDRGWPPRGPYGVRMLLRPNGEIELRQDKENKLLWSSGTKGLKPVRTRFHQGQLSLYDANDKLIFKHWPPIYPGAELQIGGEGSSAGARIARADGATVWAKGNPFPNRVYRMQWDDVVMEQYDDGGDGTPAIFGKVTVSPVGSAHRTKGHSNILWDRSDDKGARVILEEDQSYATIYKNEFNSKYQEFSIGPGPKGDYADIKTKGVKVSIDLWDYDRWSANDHIGTVEKTVYFKDFVRPGWKRSTGWTDGEQKIDVSGAGVKAVFKFKFERKK